MGMAASQARFLGLTARKTNVEYEGQQVNQQRTALSNESAGLFNQMLTLQVPTPPSATDYYNTRYVFDSMGEDFSITKYDTAAGGAAGAYSIVVEYSETERKGYSSSPITQGTPMEFNNQVPTKIYLDGKEYEITLADAAGVDKGNIETINTAIISNDATRRPEDDTYYKYTVNKGETGERKYYISSFDIANATLPDDGSTYTGGLTQYFAADATVKKTTNATASFTTTTDGRFESVKITDVDNENLKDKLVNKTFELDLTQINDSEGYEAAMKDYEYQKMVYERAIQDINARTEIIQQQDRTLELRLKQLDTEQEALKTEMDAVKEVIQKNVESTFKTFA